MKKTIVSLALVSFAALILVASCQKTYNPSQTGTVKPSLNQLFAGLRYVPQTLSVQAGRDTVVFGTNGTMLHFYTYSFMDANNHILTSGTVNLQLVEMYKPGDMICNRATTIANGQILQSGGQITINATMNGQAVYTNKYGIGFQQAGQSSTSMSLFFGTTGNADSIATWTQGDTTHVGSTVNGTTYDSNVNFYFFDTCNNLGWVNCDRFCGSDSPKISITVVLPDTSFNPSNTQLFLVLPDINSVLSNAEDWRGNNSYVAAANTFMLMSEGQSDIVPAGMNYKLVVIAIKNGQYYYYQQSGVLPHNGLLAASALTQDTQTDIISRLQEL